MTPMGDESGCQRYRLTNHTEASDMLSGTQGARAGKPLSTPSLLSLPLVGPGKTSRNIERLHF